MRSTPWTKAPNSRWARAGMTSGSTRFFVGEVAQGVGDQPDPYRLLHRRPGVDAQHGQAVDQQQAARVRGIIGVVEAVRADDDLVQMMG
jgi:hypothetical protein